MYYGNLSLPEKFPQENVREFSDGDI